MALTVYQVSAWPSFAWYQ